MQDYPNILWIVLDTLREDYSGPIWEVLKKYGFIKYENVIAPAPWTIPSHVSMFTGEYPTEHGIHESKKLKVPHFKVSPAIRKHFIFDYYRSLGYTIKFYSANSFISPFTGIYYPPFYDIFEGKYKSFLGSDDRLLLARISAGSSRRIDKVISLLKSQRYSLLLKLGLEYSLLRSLRKRAEWPIDKGVSKFYRAFFSNFGKNTDPEFVFVNLMEAHEPYSWEDTDTARIYQEHLKRGILNSDVVNGWKAGYFKCVRFLADCLERLFVALEKRNGLKNTLVIVTSDHGQLLGEHNHIGHGQWLYDELVRVPLFVRYPEFLLDNTNKLNLGDTKHYPNQYLSLISLHKFLRHLVGENLSVTLEEFYSKNVYSESHGVHLDIGEIQTREEYLTIDKLEKHRIAVYHGPYKGIYNVDDKVFECIKDHSKTETAEGIEDMLLEDVKRFLKQAKLKNAAKKLKLKGKI